ncbi:MAG: hypothetical protein ACOH17_09185 [Cellulomonas sp.]
MTSRPWYRNNTVLVRILPLLIIFVAVSKTGFDGTARLVVQLVSGVLLLGFIVLAIVNTRTKSR